MAMSLPLSAMFRRALLCLLALTLQLSAYQAIARHDPGAALTAESERHVVLNQQSLAHGHIHDDGENDERVAGHLHGHNPADHSHDPPVSVAAIYLDPQADARGWPRRVETAMNGRSGDSIDRPPESLSSM